MNYEPVEGVHYIFDRYTFLNNILQDGNFTNVSFVSKHDQPRKEDDIRQAIKLARAMYHPDRQQRSGEKMQREAERMSRLIDDCERFLTNPELRSHYEAKLEDFQKNKPEMVSVNGMAIINLGEEVLDVNSLLSDDIVDTRDFEERVKALTQYDEKSTSQAQSLFDAMGDNPQIRDLYRSALTKKLVYLTLLEDAAWAKIGVINRKNKIDGHLTSSDTYAEKVEESLKKISSAGIESEFDRRGDSARIGLSQLPLLLNFNPVAGNSPAPVPATALMDAAQMSEILAKLKQTARQNFEIRADYVRDVSRQKQELLGALVALTPVTTLNEPQPENPLYYFFLVANDGNVLLRMDLDVSTGQSSIGHIFNDPVDVPTLKKQVFDRNALLVERNSEITDILVEISGAAERIFQEHKHRFEKTEPLPPAPQP
ncbi:MAG: hypothetical protein JWO78_2137 [Micavibrio sp.]|nr:hypothetical protein [Micavibrio sp.]